LLHEWSLWVYAITFSAAVGEAGLHFPPKAELVWQGEPVATLL